MFLQLKKNNLNPFIIRQSKKKQIAYVLLVGFFILYYFIGPYDKSRIIYEKSPVFTIILGVIFISLLIYFGYELLKREAEITLSFEGIELREKGYYHWDTISSFKTVYYSGIRIVQNEDLVLSFKEFADIKFDISHLEKDRDDLIKLIIKYKGTSGGFYIGHEVSQCSSVLLQFNSATQGTMLWKYIAGIKKKKQLFRDVPNYKEITI